MRNRNLACGLTTGQLIGYQARSKRMISLCTYGKLYIHTRMDREIDRYSLQRSCLFSISRTTLFITAWQLLAENGDQSLMACNIALESHHAKGQVCLKFALQCISGDDLDLLSLVPPRVQRETASFQPFPSSNYVSSPVNIWHRVTSLRLSVSPQTTLFSWCQLLTPRVFVP